MCPFWGGKPKRGVPTYVPESPRLTTLAEFYMGVELERGNNTPNPGGSVTGDWDPFKNPLNFSSGGSFKTPGSKPDLSAEPISALVNHVGARHMDYL
jgi:hypothetical protein